MRCLDITELTNIPRISVNVICMINFTIQETFKIWMVSFLELLQNLSIKGKTYVPYYEIYRPMELYKKGLFRRITPVFFFKKNIFLVKNYGPVSALPLLYLNKKWNFMLDKKIISRCYPDGSF